MVSKVGLNLLAVMNNLIVLCCLFLLIQIFVKIINYFSYYKFISIQTLSAFSLNRDVIYHVQKMSVNKVKKYDASYLSQRINNDSNTVVSFAIKALTQLPMNIISSLVIIGILLYINIVIGVFLVIITAIYLGLYIGFRKKVFDMSYIYKERQNKFFTVLLEQIEKVKFIKINSLFNLYNQKLNDEFDKFWGDTKKTQMFFYFYSSLYSIVVSIAQIGIFNTITYISDFTKEYQDNKVSYHRLEEILNREEQTNGKIHIHNVTEIECKNLTIRRDNNVVIKDFSYVFNKGKIYGLIVENGSGKSTLVEAILGLFVDEFEGNIKINNTNIREINMNKLRMEKMAFLEQNPQLITNNIFNNIFITEQHKDAILKNKLSNINLQQILSDKNIYDKQEKIGGLSGGETQKVTLMRTLSKDADVYIFDEGSSALDKNGKKILLTCLKELKQNSIVIVVSHDDNLINVSDEIVNLGDKTVAYGGAVNC